MHPRLTRIGATCLLGAGVAGCRAPEGTGPVSLPEQRSGSTYVLRSVAGTPIPAPLVEREDLTIVILADTLWLRADGTGLKGVVERYIDHTTGAAGELLASEHPFTWQERSGRLEVAFECRDVILRQCLAPPHYVGSIGGSGIMLESRTYGRGPLHYERIQD